MRKTFFLDYIAYIIFVANSGNEQSFDRAGDATRKVLVGTVCLVGFATGIFILLRVFPSWLKLINSVHSEIISGLLFSLFPLIVLFSIFLKLNNKYTNSRLIHLYNQHEKKMPIVAARTITFIFGLFSLCLTFLFIIAGIYSLKPGQ